MVESERRTFPDLVRDELASAFSLHSWSGEPAEAWAVVQEEVDEFWEEVRKARCRRNRERMLYELVQIGAMVQRAAVECYNMHGQSFECSIAYEIANPPETKPVIRSAHHAYCLFMALMSDWLLLITRGEHDEIRESKKTLLAFSVIVQSTAQDLGLVSKGVPKGSDNGDQIPT